MARTKRRIRNRGRKSQKRKPVRTRRRRRGSAKRRRTKRGNTVLKGKGCLGGFCGRARPKVQCHYCKDQGVAVGFSDEASSVGGPSDLDNHICDSHCPVWGGTCSAAYNCP